MTEAPEPEDKLDAATKVAANGPEDATFDWHQIDWRQAEADVRRLRQRIFTASQAGNPGFPSPFGCRRSLLGHPIPAGELGSPHGRLTEHAIGAPGPRRGYRVPHARAATGVGAPYTPRTAVLLPD